MTVRFDTLTIDWLGYATVRLDAPDAPVVYMDPGRYGVLTGEWAEQYGGRPHPQSGPLEPTDGDLVLVTHDHHYDPDGIRRVAAPDATIVVFEAVDADRIAANRGTDVEPPEALPYEVRRVGTAETLDLRGARVETVPAYNLPDGRNARPDGTVGHPKGFGCGYLVTLGQRRCFWTGDTDRLPEHDGLDVSVFLPTIPRNITMNRHEAAALAADLQPDLVVPVHYNTFDRLAADARAFAADVAGHGVPVALDEA